MNRTYNKWLKGSCLTAALAVVATACTDDHFDVVTGSGSASQTIWENIISGEEMQLDSFANLLSRIYVMRSETDASSMKQTNRDSMFFYSDYLSTNQTFTVFAPEDGTYDEEYVNYIELLDRADRFWKAWEAGDQTSRDSAISLRYTVANQFAANHIARFNNEGSDRSGGLDVRMLNSKVYNYTDSTFNDVRLNGLKYNSTNGSVYGLEGVAPFYYNIFEYLEAYSQFSKVYAALNDTTIASNEFSESQSTEGVMNNNGEMEYIDSVYVYTNEYLDEANASIRNEDSLYIAIIPTDDAWDEAYEVLAPYFQYGTSYGYDWSTSDKKFASTVTGLDADSLQYASTVEALMKNMYFSATTLNSAVDKNSFEALETYAAYADSLESTNRVVYLNVNSDYAKNDLMVTDINTILKGAGRLNPIFDNAGDWYETSNGIIYGQTSYNVDPRYTWLGDDEINAYAGTLDLSGGSYEQITLTSSTLDSAAIDTLGGWDAYDQWLSDDKYTRYTVSGSSSMTIYLRLPQVYSGTYSISIVMAPSRINQQYNSSSTYGTATLDGSDEVTVFTAEVLDDQGNKLSGWNAEGEYANASGDITVDSIGEYVLFDRLTFPKCYNNLPDDYSNSFPRLAINLTSRYQTRVGNCRALNIVKVLIEPYRGDEEE